MRRPVLQLTQFLLLSSIVVGTSTPGIAQSEFFQVGESGSALAAGVVAADGLTGVGLFGGASANGIVDFQLHYSYADGTGAGNNTSSFGISTAFHVTRKLLPRLPVLVGSIGYQRFHHNFSDSDNGAFTVGPGIYYRLRIDGETTLIPYGSFDALISERTYGAASAGLALSYRPRNTAFTIQFGMSTIDGDAGGAIAIGLAKANPVRRWQ